MSAREVSWDEVAVLVVIVLAADGALWTAGRFTQREAHTATIQQLVVRGGSSCHARSRLDLTRQDLRITVNTIANEIQTPPTLARSTRVRVRVCECTSVGVPLLLHTSCLHWPAVVVSWCPVSLTFEGNSFVRHLCRQIVQIIGH